MKKKITSFCQALKEMHASSNAETLQNRQHVVVTRSREKGEERKGGKVRKKAKREGRVKYGMDGGAGMDSP